MENLTQKTETKSEVATAKENLEGILDAVKFAYDATDNNATKDVLTAVTRCVITAIQTNYRGLTLAELREAITRGASGLYGLVFKLNASVIVSWIENYWQATAELRAAAARAARKAIAPTATITESEKQAAREKLLESLYDDYLTGRESGFSRPYAIVFDYLWQTNQFRPTREHCAEVLSRAQVVNDKNLSIFARAVGRDSTENEKRNNAKKILVFEFFEQEKKRNNNNKKSK